MMKMENSNRISLEVYPHQVSGKEPKLLTPDGTKILKGFNQNEQDFYLSVNHPEASLPLQLLRPFLATFYGKLDLNQDPTLVISNQNQNEWLTHLASRYKIRNQSNKFTILQNLTLHYEYPNIFDIKIGGRNVEGKAHKITKSVSNFSLKLNGCKLESKEQKMMLTKYFLGNIMKFQDMCECIAFFFKQNNNIQDQALTGIMQKLQALISVFKTIKGLRFISSSVWMSYDGANPSKTDLRLIDFGRVSAEPNFFDVESLQGMENILLILKQILERKQHFQSKLQAIRQRFQQSQTMHIPEHKRTKAESTDHQSSL